MAVEVKSEALNLGNNRNAHDQKITEYMEQGWDILSTVPLQVTNGLTASVLVTFIRDDEEGDEE